MDERLIELVQEKIFLYNKKSSLYKNNLVKSEAWKEIAAKLSSTEDQVKRRWGSLRDQYNREIRRNQLPSGSGPVTSNSRFKHLERMAFLLEAYKPRKTIANLRSEDSTLSQVVFEEDTISDLDDPFNIPPSGQPPSQDNDGSTVSTTDSLEQRMSLFLEKASESITTTDDLTYFFKYVEKIVRDANLSPQRKLVLQQSIISIVMQSINNT